MKNLYFLLVIVTVGYSCNSSKNAKDERSDLVLKVTTTSDYCGGVAPSDKVLENLKAPKMYAEKEIYVTTESKLNEQIIKLTTDSKGMITTKLEKGTYFVYLPEKSTTKFTTGGNEKACRQWRNKPNGNFYVTDEEHELAVTLHITCSPCGAPRM